MGVENPIPNNQEKIKLKKDLDDFLSDEEMMNKLISGCIEKLSNKIKDETPEDFQKTIVDSVFDFYKSAGRDRKLNFNYYYILAAEIQKLLNNRDLNPELAEKFNTIIDNLAKEYKSELINEKADIFAREKIADHPDYIWYKDKEGTLSELNDKLRVATRAARLDGNTQKKSEIQEQIDKFREKCNEFEKNILQPVKVEKFDEYKTGIDIQKIEVILEKNEIDKIKNNILERDISNVGIMAGRLKYENSGKHLEELENENKEAVHYIFHAMGNSFNQMKSRVYEFENKQ